MGLADRVRVLGRRSDVGNLLAASDVFVLPSLVEGMPLALIEAMASGLPVIATAVDGIPEVLGDTGVLLSEPTEESSAVDELARALRDLALQNNSSRRHLGELCRLQAAQFHEDRMIAAYVHLVEHELLRGAPTLK